LQAAWRPAEAPTETAIILEAGHAGFALKERRIQADLFH